MVVFPNKPFKAGCVLFKLCVYIALIKMKTKVKKNNPNNPLRFTAAR